ncbi:hypothetical protein CO540_08955 [Micromonospora sp. WMMA2032]|uniref:lipid II:glycine glycyltransferase FemX n=1 Tax=unclassified Micromonospora TaxID=2617518 RepID=UPI000C058291|nr:GNAT family N-acetyltransferase [Micromonospora sp. WMMA2032]ATO13943.1 hypothetical protein CO540_08955 [Micromonospora sp. WMMA2032]
MTIQVRALDSTADTDSTLPDVYFTSGYGQAAAAAEGGVWRSLHIADGDLVVPHVLRQVDPALSDAVSPYGYSGLHLAPHVPAAELPRLWAAAAAHWRASGVVSLFLRFSPWDLAAVEAARAVDDVVLTRRADTVLVAVDGGPTAIWEAMAGRSRTAVRKAERVGLTATVRATGREDLAPGSAFRRLYEQTMIRVGSTPEYLFPEAYYRLLADGLGKSLLLAEVRDGSGRVVAAALVMRHRERAHYHLAGSDPAAARDGANNLLLWTILQWAAEHGCVAVHLGGGVRPDDGLFRFKSSFGGERVPFWTGAVVLLQARYDELLARHAAAHGRPTDVLRQSGFFPGYRWRAS